MIEKKVEFCHSFFLHLSPHTLCTISRVCFEPRFVTIGLNFWPQFTLERINSLLTRVIGMQYIAF